LSSIAQSTGRIVRETLEPLERAVRRLEAAAGQDVMAESEGHRAVTTAVLHKVCEGFGELLGSELKSRDDRLDELENCVRGLVQIEERRRSSQSD